VSIAAVVMVSGSDHDARWRIYVSPDGDAGSWDYIGSEPTALAAMESVGRTDWRPHCLKRCYIAGPTGKTQDAPTGP